MAESNNWGSLGKKVFFLYPAALIQNQIAAELAQEEFEVYTVRDENKLKRVLHNYKDSIILVNINEGLKESAWEEWIKGLIANPETPDLLVSVISMGNDDTLKRKYTELLKGRGGFMVLKSDMAMMTKQLIDILNGMNAKGRRKYIRAITENETNTTVNLPINGTYVNGMIKDLSVVGFSCSFADDPNLTKNSLFGDLQLRLQSQLIKAEGIVFGSRMEGTEKVYVILFTQRINPDVKTRIRKYIQSNLQSKMDIELR